MQVCRRIIITLVCLMALFVLQETAGNAAVAPLSEVVEVGLNEKLGMKIPLDIQLTDESGRVVRLAELITRPTLIVPVYFSCSNICYATQQGLAAVLPTIRSKPGVDYNVISVSFDEHDTPQLAAKFKRVYLGSMHSQFPPDSWHFLTGDAKTVRQLTDAAGYGYQRRGRDFLHPAASFIVGADGTIIRYLYGTRFLAKDLTLALVEARDGISGITIRKMVEYCFSFDPKQQTYVFNLLRISATVVILCCGGFMAFLFLGGKKGKNGQSL